MKEYVNEMLIESTRKKGPLCASDMMFNANTINNYMALFANKGGISLTEKSIAKTNARWTAKHSSIGIMALIIILWSVHISMLLPVMILNGVNFSTHYQMIQKYCMRWYQNFMVESQFVSGDHIFL